MRTIVLACLLAAAGCGGANHHEPDEYTGCGTDEVYAVFEDHEPAAVVDAASAPAVTQPASDATVDFAAKVVLQWSEDANDAGAKDGDVPYMGPSCTDCCPEFNKGALTTLHEPAISGDAYDLHFGVDGALDWRVVTTLQEWTPPDEVWARWRGKTVSVQIYRMTVQDNTVQAGPFVAPAPFVFHVGG